MELFPISTTRNIGLDAQAGLFILLIMCQHFNILTMAPYTLGHLFMFNTVWFFWKAGMYHRPQKLTKTFLKFQIKKFIIPFILLISFAMTLCITSEIIINKNANLYNILYSFAAQIIYNGAPWWNIPLWFLATFFLVKITMCNYKGEHIAIWIICCLCIGFVHYLIIGEQFNYIGNTSIAILFYILGYHLSAKILDKRLYYILASAFILISIFSPCAFDIFANKPRFGNYFLSLIMCVIGIILINKTFSHFRFLRLTPLIFVGQNAMIFLIFHVPIAMLIRSFLIGKGYDLYLPYIEAIFSISFCFTVWFLIKRNKKYQWIIGK